MDNEKLREEVANKGVKLDVYSFVDLLNKVSSIPDNFGKKNVFSKDDIDKLINKATELKTQLIIAFEKNNCQTDIKRSLVPYNVHVSDFLDSLRRY